MFGLFVVLMGAEGSGGTGSDCAGAGGSVFVSKDSKLFLSSRAEHNYPQLAAISKFSGNPVFR